MDFHEYDIAKTYVLAAMGIFPTRVWGYVTLMSSEIVLNEDQRPQEISALAKYEAFSAIKIALLAVDKALQGQGYGSRMVQWCVTLVRCMIMPHMIFIKINR